MCLKTSISMFLKKKLLKNNIKLITLSRESSIPYQTIKNLHLGLKSNPELYTLIKLANYFQCSIDEVVGRDHKYFINNQDKLYSKNIEIDQIMDNLKSFITSKSTEYKIALSRLSLNIGFNSDLLANFTQNKPRIKRLGSKPVVALADYFDVSVDELIGRKSYNHEESELSYDSGDITDN